MNELSQLYWSKRMLEMKQQQQEAARGAVNAMAIQYEPPTLKQNLLDRRSVLLAELDKINEALQLFETEPRVTDAIEIIMKAMR